MPDGRVIRRGLPGFFFKGPRPKFRPNSVMGYPQTGMLVFYSFVILLVCNHGPSYSGSGSSVHQIRKGPCRLPNDAAGAFFGNVRGVDGFVTCMEDMARSVPGRHGRTYP